MQKDNEKLQRNAKKLEEWKVLRKAAHILDKKDSCSEESLEYALKMLEDYAAPYECYRVALSKKQEDDEVYLV